MIEGNYGKGGRMTFPLELTQVQEDHASGDLKYLYPVEAMALQQDIEEMCDKMEYDGSIMYDRYPDKVQVEAMAKELCRKCNCKYRSEISVRWMNTLAQMMLCNEMAYRRERRCCHKRNMGK